MDIRDITAFSSNNCGFVFVGGECVASLKRVTNPAFIPCKTKIEIGGCFGRSVVYVCGHCEVKRTDAAGTRSGFEWRTRKRTTGTDANGRPLRLVRGYDSEHRTDKHFSDDTSTDAIVDWVKNDFKQFVESKLAGIC